MTSQSIVPTMLCKVPRFGSWDWKFMHVGASVQGVSAKEGVEVSGADGAGCPCDQQAACRAPPAQRIWVSFISPSLLLFAMCIHGIFEGLTLGIQV